jgi:hypothetical protein
MRSILLGLLLSLALTSPASAFFKCKTWETLEDEEKRELLLERIDQAMTSNEAKKYDVNKVRLKRCLEEQAWDMQEQFDGICAEGKSASMQALNDMFTRYIWSCVGQ